MLQPFDLWGQRGWHGQEVVGEASYVDDIGKLLGKVTAQWTEVIVTAQLLPEPSNKHDRNAVQVKVDGSVVGYLPREEAPSYVPVLTRLVADGWLPQVSATVSGAMVSDYDYDGRGRLVGKERLQGSVRLDLAEPPC